MTQSITVTAWNNGKPSKTGSGYGLKISINDRDNYICNSAEDTLYNMNTNNHEHDCSHFKVHDTRIR